MDVQTSEIVYRTIDGRERKALIFRPEGATNSPAMVCMHGGAWISGDRNLPSYMAQKLAARGFVVMSIDFRMAPRHMYPSSLRDANYAVRWLRQHAVEYGVDAERIGGLGFSSGAHLILLSAMRPEHADYIADIPPELQGYSAKLDWVISCSGVLDPLARYRMAQQGNYTDIVACHDKYFGTEACMAEANPPLILERGEPAELPPLLMFQGGADPRLPPNTASRMAELYTAAGGKAEAVIYPGLGHSLAEWPVEMQDQVADRMQAFVMQG
jgi:acetyl esterase/lipase